MGILNNAVWKVRQVQNKDIEFEIIAKFYKNEKIEKPDKVLRDYLALNLCDLVEQYKELVDSDPVGKSIGNY